jgi:hypothetical protein
MSKIGRLLTLDRRLVWASIGIVMRLFAAPAASHAAPAASAPEGQNNPPVKACTVNADDKKPLTNSSQTHVSPPFAPLTADEMRWLIPRNQTSIKAARENQKQSAQTNGTNAQMGDTTAATTSSALSSLQAGEEVSSLLVQQQIRLTRPSSHLIPQSTTGTYASIKNPLQLSQPGHNSELWNSFYPAQRRLIQVGRSSSFSPSPRY